MDWLHSLSEALNVWIDSVTSTSNREGKLILAWANLGAILEGGLKLFLTVYYLEYKNSKNNKRDRKGDLKNPDSLSLEELKVFFKKENIIDKKWFDFISDVQRRRNAIHAYKDRDIGDWNKFFEFIVKFCELTKYLKGRLPYPE